MWSRRPEARSIARACGLAVALGLFIASISLSANAADPEKAVTKIESEGCAEGTTPASRDAAVLDATRNAVRLWLEMELGAPLGDEFLPLLDAANRYAASSRPLRVHSAEGRTCAELEVYLYEWPLRADTAALLFGLRAAPPRVAFLIIEENTTQNSRAFQQHSRTAKILAEAFAAKGFTILTPGASDTAYSERELLSIAETGPAALARYGAEQGADAVVAVETQLSATKPQGAGSQVLRARAQVRVRIVGTADGRLHDSSQGEAEIDTADSASGHGFALVDAIYKVRDHAIAGAILASESETGQHVRLTLEGVGDFVAAERFAELLRGTEGVGEANVISVRGGSALLQLTYAGRMGPLVERLTAGGPGFPKLDVVKVVGTEMLLRALP